nr:MAG: beta-grasp domain [Lokiarchaeota virus Ratatoskr Meg22_1012]
MTNPRSPIQDLLVLQKTTVRDFLEANGYDPKRYAVVLKRESRRIGLDEEISEGMNITVIPIMKGGM